MSEIDNIADSLLDSQPEVQPHAIEADTPQTPTYSDLLGNVFDPSRHALGPDGRPSLTRSGRFRRRKGTGSILGTVPPSGQIPIARTDAGSIDPKQGARASAVVVVDSVEALAVGLAGEEWKYHEGQRDSGYEAWTAYFLARGVTDIPPGVLVACWSAGYVLPNLAKPKTTTKIEKLKTWFQIRVLRRRLETSTDSDTRVDPGNDRERKNDTSKKAK